MMNRNKTWNLIKYKRNFSFHLNSGFGVILIKFLIKKSGTGNILKTFRIEIEQLTYFLANIYNDIIKAHLCDRLGKEKLTPTLCSATQPNE